MPYQYRFYRFADATGYLTAWAEAGLPIIDGAPALPGGALDEIGVASVPATDPDAPPAPLEGWYVNAAWPGAPPEALQPHAIAPFEGLRAFAGWSDPEPPPPVPEMVTNFQARTALRHAGMFDAANAALAAMAADMDAAGDAIGAATLREAWERASFMRASALVAAVGAQLSLTSAQMDELFRAAAQIEV